MFSVFMATSAFALEVDQAIDEEIELQYVYTNYVTSMLSISSKMQLVNQMLMVFRGSK